MNFMEWPIKRFYIVAVILGALALLNSIAFRQKGVGVVFSILLDLLMLATAYLAGSAARKAQRKSAWTSAGIGAVFGAFIGMAGFFIKFTAANLGPHHYTPQEQHLLLTMANSPTTHIFSLLLSIVLYGVLALLIGALTSALTKMPRNPKPPV
ncbi:MAG: hypothetical protein OWS74_01560 [Firmicutes bacterium]|nr:hypothetical protein [Bacillota bacterium]